MFIGDSNAASRLYLDTDVLLDTERTYFYVSLGVCT
jgi:hypothetical protein